MNEKNISCRTSAFITCGNSQQENKVSEDNLKMFVINEKI